jgi:hypothetical protein
MKRPSFFEGVGVGLGASLAGSVLHTALSLVLPGSDVLRMVIAGLGLAYVFYLLGRSPERVGRVTALAAWVPAALAIWLLGPPLVLFLLLHLGLVWLVRSLYYHASLLAALGDLGLAGLGLAAAVWALVHTGSLFLGLWCFFLVQALFVVIPSRRGGHPPDIERDREDRFQNAHRMAEGALRRLSSIR